MSTDKTDGGPDPVPIKNCGNISFNTDINSPQENALNGLEEDDVLNVILNNNKVVVVRNDTNDTVGSINWASVRRLIECIEEGYEYIATIRSIQDGLIKVHVSAK